MTLTVHRARVKLINYLTGLYMVDRTKTVTDGEKINISKSYKIYEVAKSHCSSNGSEIMNCEGQ